MAWILVTLGIFTVINLLCVDEGWHIFGDTLKWAHVLFFVFAVISILHGDFALIGFEWLVTLVLAVVYFNVVSVFWWIGEWADSQPVSRTTQSRTTAPEIEVVYGEVMDEAEVPQMKALPMFMNRRRSNSIPVYQAEDYCKREHGYTETFHDPHSNRDFCVDCGEEKLGGK